mmetsp:Transcript_55766/g.146676  ORF Transcript_55766/g.146676 Transcript_55766/m.146676 type:complete len:514 (-) Transcript_55766:24-1565(-)
MEGLLGHGHQQRAHALGREPEDLRLEERLVAGRRVEAEVALGNLTRLLHLLLLAEARLLVPGAHQVLVRPERVEDRNGRGLLSLDGLEEVQQQAEGVQGAAAGREALDPGVQRLQHQQILQRPLEGGRLGVPQHIDDVGSILRPEVEPLWRDVALPSARQRRLDHRPKPLEHCHAGGVPGAEQHVGQLRGGLVHGRDLHLGASLQALDPLARGAVELGPLVRPGLREVRPGGRHAPAVQGRGREHPAQQRLRLQNVARLLLRHDLALLVRTRASGPGPDELRLEGWPPDLLQARRRNKRRAVLLVGPERPHQLGKLRLFLVVQMPIAQRRGYVDEESRRHLVVLGGGREELRHEPEGHRAVEECRQRADLLIRRRGDEQGQRDRHAGLLQLGDARPCRRDHGALLRLAPTPGHELQGLLQAPASRRRILNASGLVLEVLVDRGEAQLARRRHGGLQHLDEEAVLLVGVCGCGLGHGCVLLRPLRVRGLARLVVLRPLHAPLPRGEVRAPWAPV